MVFLHSPPLSFTCSLDVNPREMIVQQRPMFIGTQDMSILIYPRLLATAKQFPYAGDPTGYPQADPPHPLETS